MNKFARKFSIPHNDIQRNVMDGPEEYLGFDTKSEDEDFFYNTISNAHPSFREEIADVFFGKSFLYKLGGTTRRYGDVMGKEASDKQIDNLFEIQKKYDIPASLTINQETHPIEILANDDIRNQFINWIGGFYERGLRICTISNIHLMGSGHLQQNFPEMEWKNTVNHIVSNVQQMIDLISIGYTMIQLDRSLNRNMSELRRCSKEARNRGIKTILLASEGCMPHCPFKQEHDTVQPWIGSTMGKSYFDTLGHISCNKWRYKKDVFGDTHFVYGKLPRVGTQCEWDTNERFDLYNDLVDNLKFSGRLMSPYANSKAKSYACWSYRSPDGQTNFLARSFKDVYDTGIGFLSEWNGRGYVTTTDKDEENMFIHNPKVKARAEKYFDKIDHIYKTEAGMKMVKALPNCKNQCYDCHLCEDAYGLEHFDSLCEINRGPEFKEYIQTYE